jgi:hypothetical protein
MNDFLLYESIFSLKLIETVRTILTMQNRIKEFFFVVKQAWFTNINWFVCFVKFIWWSLSLLQIWLIRKKKPSILFIIWFIVHGCHFYIYNLYYCNILASLKLITLFTKNNIISKIIVMKKMHNLLELKRKSLYENFKIH